MRATARRMPAPAMADQRKALRARWRFMRRRTEFTNFSTGAISVEWKRLRTAETLHCPGGMREKIFGNVRTAGAGVRGGPEGRGSRGLGSRCGAGGRGLGFRG